MDTLLTLTEAARRLHCSRSLLYRLMGGRYADVPPLPALRLGRIIRICREALQAWLLTLERRESEAQHASGLFVHGIRDEEWEYIAGA